MASPFALHVNVAASPVERDTVPCADQEYIQSINGYLKFTRMCFLVVERGSHWRYVENLLLLKYRLCRHGSYLVADHDTSCRISLDLLQIEDIIRTIDVHVERMVTQNSHCEKITLVISCDVIVPRYGRTAMVEADNDRAPGFLGLYSCSDDRSNR
ncbi:RING-type domain-containing protein [Psidium guajava]|nr:RING-type domain-containing protein [Psidium guajava]